MIIPILIKLSLTSKIIQVLLASALKFIVAPLLAKQLGFYYFEAIILTTVGGIAGAVFFFYASAAVFKFIRYIYKKIRLKLQPQKITVPEKTKTKKVFTRRNKFIIKLRGKFGLFGIIALTPPLFSIPFGSILANKYYYKNKKILVYLSISVVFWSWVFTSVFYLAF